MKSPGHAIQGHVQTTAEGKCSNLPALADTSGLTCKFPHRTVGGGVLGFEGIFLLWGEA